MSRAFTPGLTTNEYWYTEGPYLYVYPEGKSKEAARIVFRCSAFTGISWQSNSPDVPGETDIFLVTATDQPVTTTAGDFSTTRINVSFSYKAEEYNQYWSDIYGLVFQEGSVSLELTAKNH